MENWDIVNVLPSKCRHWLHVYGSVQTLVTDMHLLHGGCVRGLVCCVNCLLWSGCCKGTGWDIVGAWSVTSIAAGITVCAVQSLCSYVVLCVVTVQLCRVVCSHCVAMSCCVQSLCSYVLLCVVTVQLCRVVCSHCVAMSCCVQSLCSYVVLCVVTLGCVMSALLQSTNPVATALYIPPASSSQNTYFLPAKCVHVLCDCQCESGGFMKQQVVHLEAGWCNQCGDCTVSVVTVRSVW